MKFFTAIALLGAASATDNKICNDDLEIWKDATAKSYVIDMSTNKKKDDCKSGCEDKADAVNNYYCCDYAGVTSTAGGDPTSAKCDLKTVKKDGNEDKLQDIFKDATSTDISIFAAWANVGDTGDSAIKVGATLFTAAVAALYM